MTIKVLFSLSVFVALSVIHAGIRMTPEVRAQLEAEKTTQGEPLLWYKKWLAGPDWFEMEDVQDPARMRHTL